MAISRAGRITFGDAQIQILDHSHPGSGVSAAEQDAWTAQFKKEVFARIVQTLNRLGWTCELPPFNQSDKDRYPSIYEASRRRTRLCRKGDLQGELDLQGSCITFQMWQDVVAKNRHGGRYDFGKEARMPYLLGLEMERTRRRIRDYLCNVIEGYVFTPDKRLQAGPGMHTALEAILEERKHSGHFRPELGRASYTNEAQASGDGLVIEDGAQVYAVTYKGRLIRGTALYCLNGNWTIVSGRYGITRNVWHKQVFVERPGDVRLKRNSHLREQALESELRKAVARMDFRRAEVLRDLRWPDGNYPQAKQAA